MMPMNQCAILKLHLNTVSDIISAIQSQFLADVETYIYCHDHFLYEKSEWQILLSVIHLQKTL